MPRLAVQNATPRALDLVLRGSDHAVFAAQDVVAPGATWTYAFHGALVVQTLDVDVHCAADARQRGICAVAATCLRLAALALFPPVALLDLLRTPRPLSSSSSRAQTYPSGPGRTRRGARAVDANASRTLRAVPHRE
jgi:hypothetical protein